MADEQAAPLDPRLEVDFDILDEPTAGATALRGGVLRTTGYVAGVLLTLVSTPLLIRHLGVADFGRYTTITSLVVIVGGLTEGGLNALALREYSTLDGEARTREMRSFLGLRLLLTIGGVAIAVAFAAVAGYGSTLVLGTIGVGVGLLLLLTQTMLSTGLQARLSFGWVTIAEMVRQVLVVAAILALVFAGASLFPFFLAQIPGCLATLLLTAWLVRGDMPFRPSFEGGRSWAMLAETLPFAIAIALNVMYFRVTIVIMSLAASALETGYFATSFRVVEVVLAVPALLIGAAFPVLSRAARDDEDRWSYATVRIIGVAVVAGAGVALAIELGAQIAIDVLAGSDSQPSVGVLRIQGLALLANFVTVAVAYSLLSLKEYRRLLVVNLAALVVSVTLALVLVPSHGAHGGAIATVTAEYVLALASMIAIARVRPGVVAGLRVLPGALLAAGLGSVVLFIPAIPDVLGVVIGMTVFLALVLVLRLLPSEVTDTFRERVLRRA